MHTLRRFVNRVARDECGQDMVEYALILALVSIAAVGAVTVAGESIGSYWSKLSAKLAPASTFSDSPHVPGAPLLQTENRMSSDLPLEISSLRVALMVAVWGYQSSLT